MLLPCSICQTPFECCDSKGGRLCDRPSIFNKPVAEVISEPIVADPHDDPWIWQGDGSDDLDSMGVHMRVSIMAGQLRALVKTAIMAGQFQAAMKAIDDR